MSDENIIESNDNYRVRIGIDSSPEQPYDDGGWPIMRMDTGSYGTNVTHIDSGGRSHVMDSNVESAISQWGSPSSPYWHFVEKYLRAFHGVTKIQWYRSNDYWYVAYDSADWREYVGFEGPMPEGGWPYQDEKPLAEWEAYINGEVYYYVVEQRFMWQQVDNPEVSLMETWEQVDSCGGFYGYDYAVEAAREAYASVARGQ
jgi:hypothetical protein